MTESEKQLNNERIKLSAEYYNNLAVVAASTGFIIPTVSLAYAGQPIELKTFLPVLVGLGLGLVLKWYARWELRFLNSTNCPTIQRGVAQLRLAELVGILQRLVAWRRVVKRLAKIAHVHHAEPERQPLEPVN